MFHYELGIKNDSIKEIVYRQALRAVIFKDNKVLMVKTNKGDYKFPGGGANKDEGYKETLIREVSEETGYIVCNVKEKLGVIVERNIDNQNENAIFEMNSRYYLCEISNERTTQKLDEYEKELEFKGEWISIDDAIAANESILISWKCDKNPWVYRETNALKDLSRSAKINEDKL